MFPFFITLMTYSYKLIPSSLTGITSNKKGFPCIHRIMHCNCQGDMPFYKYMEENGIRILREIEQDTQDIRKICPIDAQNHICFLP